MVYHYSNTAVSTTLSVPLSSGGTTASFTSTSGFPPSYPYTVVIEPDTTNIEVVTVTGPNGAGFFVDRGQDGTVAQSHAALSPVVHAVVARDLADPQAHMTAATDVHGLSGGDSVVGLTSTQTLTNKTMSGAANTFTNIPDSAITALAASKLTGSFPTISSAGSVTATTTVTAGTDVVATEGVTASGTSGGVPFSADIPSGSSANLLTLTKSAAARVSVANDGAIDSAGAITAAGTVTSTAGTLNLGADTNLYRVGADSLKTDDSLTVVGSLNVVGAGGLGPTNWMIFADATARDAALTGSYAPTEGMACFLKDSDSVTVYSGSAWRTISSAEIDFSSSFEITASTTNPTKGNSTYTAGYAYSGGAIAYDFSVAFGSTYSAGSGTYSFLVPVAASTISTSSATGTIWVNDSGVSIRIGVMYFSDSTHVIAEVTPGGTLGTAAMTFGSGDALRASITYIPA